MKLQEENIIIATEIIKQLGGSKFRAMTGAKNFFAHESGVSFSLPGSGGFCKNGINYVKITLNSLDLYDIEFLRIRGTKVNDVAAHNGIYNDMLQKIFTAETGLETHI